MDSSGTTFWTEEAESSVRIIGMRGELDSATVATFRSHVQTALADGCNVIIDFSELLYFDSVGLTAVIEAWQLAGARGHALALVTGDLVKSKFHMRGVESF